MIRSPCFLPLAALLPVVVACQQQQPRSRADVTARAECRATVDRVYAAQNRVDLSRRDERDNPFAGSYVSGIVTRGLSSRYQQDNMVASCVNAAGEPGAVSDTGPAPTFSPTTTATPIAR